MLTEFQLRWQFDIRTLCVNHWGSDQGITVLKQLSQLYMFLIWETIVLETISKSETLPEETKLVEKDLEMLKASTSASQEEPSGEDCPVKIKTVFPYYHSAILRFLCRNDWVISCSLKHNLKSSALPMRPQLPPLQRTCKSKKNKGNCELTSAVIKFVFSSRTSTWRQPVNNSDKWHRSKQWNHHFKVKSSSRTTKNYKTTSSSINCSRPCHVRPVCPPCEAQCWISSAAATGSTYCSYTWSSYPSSTSCSFAA